MGHEPAATVALTDLLLVVGLLSADVLLVSAAVIRVRRRWRKRRYERSFRDALNPELRGVLDEFVR